MTAGARRIVRSRHVVAGCRMRILAVVAADHHIITATGLGPRRSKHDRRNQHKGCRGDMTCQFPHELRDHEESKPQEEPPNCENRNNEMKVENRPSKPDIFRKSRKKLRTRNTCSTGQAAEVLNHNEHPPTIAYGGQSRFAGANATKMRIITTHACPSVAASFRHGLPAAFKPDVFRIVATAIGGDLDCHSTGLANVFVALFWGQGCMGAGTGHERGLSLVGHDDSSSISNGKPDVVSWSLEH